MNNPTIEINLGEILKEIQNDQKKLLEEVNNLKVGQARIEGKIEALDTKVEQLDTRVANQEFLNRGVFIGLLLALLGGVVKLFGWIPNA
jgi:chromosome segregation ATPase